MFGRLTSTALTFGVLAVAFGLMPGCGSRIKPDDPPPVVKAPQIVCPASTAVDSLGPSASVTFPPPVVTEGTPPVSASCAPASGAMFQSGETAVTCTATDAISRSVQCQFVVRVNIVPQLRGTNFVAFGDSITDGETATPIPQFQGGDDAYPKVLARLLQARYKLQSITVVSSGFGGETTATLRDLLPGILATHRPDALILLEGANDVNQSGTTGLENLRVNLTEQIRVAFSRGVKIVFLSTILPQCPNRLFCGPDVKNPGAVPDANQVIRQVAIAEGAVLVDNYTAFLPQATSLIGIDGLHPTKAGHQKLAEMFFEAIKINFEVPIASSSTAQPAFRTTKMRPQT